MSDILQNDTKQDEIISPQNAKPAAYSEFAVFSGPSGTLPTSSVDANYTVAIKGTFGGDGSDGPLAISSGTTTIDLGSASTVIKQYSSISITGTGGLAFSNPHTNGTIVTLKSKGDVTLTSTAAALIDLTGMGASGGSGGNGGAGSNGTKGTGMTTAATIGLAGGFVTTTGSAATTSPKLPQTIAQKAVYVACGSGGGGGGAGDPNAGQGSGGNGGAGGGGLVVECGGSLNFTGTIKALGNDGSVGGNANDEGAGGGGGGGGGGTVVVLYNVLTANTGTITITGGNGGNGGNTTGSTTVGEYGGAGGSGGAGSAFGGGASGGADTNGSNAETGGTGGTKGAGIGHADGRGGGGGGGGNGFSLVVLNSEFG